MAEPERELGRAIEPHWPVGVTRGADDVSDEFRRAIEGGDGVLAPSIAIAPRLRRGELPEVVERQGECGYRPLTIRPCRDAEGAAVAVVWARYGLRWRSAVSKGAAPLSRADAGAGPGSSPSGPRRTRP